MAAGDPPASRRFLSQPQCQRQTDGDRHAARTVAGEERERPEDADSKDPGHGPAGPGIRQQHREQKGRIEWRDWA